MLQGWADPVVMNGFDLIDIPIMPIGGHRIINHIHACQSTCFLGGFPSLSLSLLPNGSLATFATLQH